MNIECIQCGERRYIAEPVPYGNVYICKNCKTSQILAEKEKTPAAREGKKLFTAARQTAAILLVTILLVCTAGTTVAAAKTESKPQTPLEGIIAVLTGAPTSSGALLEDVQAVVAQYECSVVTESLQWMRIMERMPDVPPVTEPTNDMTVFPTPQNPLFPDFLTWKYSQFSYTVDENGTVSIEMDNLSDDIHH